MKTLAVCCVGTQICPFWGSRLGGFSLFLVSLVGEVSVVFFVLTVPLFGETFLCTHSVLFKHSPCDFCVLTLGTSRIGEVCVDFLWTHIDPYWESPHGICVLTVPLKCRSAWSSYAGKGPCGRSASDS